MVFVLVLVLIVVILVIGIDVCNDDGTLIDKIGNVNHNRME